MHLWRTSGGSLELWGYKRVEELIWVKTNQLQKVIRTGLTGHWLSHSKGHCCYATPGVPWLHPGCALNARGAPVCYCR